MRRLRPSAGLAARRCFRQPELLAVRKRRYSKSVPKSPKKVRWLENPASSPISVMESVESTNVRVTDICIRNATSWCCFFHGCEYITVRGLRVFTDPSAANTDGIDLDCCLIAGN